MAGEAMRSCCVVAPHQAEVSRGEVPEVPPGWVLCRVAAMGICGTDVEIYTGELPYLRTGAVRYPVVPGHEWVGRVAALGAGVTSLAEEDRVTGETHVGCGRCPECLAGRYNQCDALLRVGIGGLPGACADYILLPGQALHRLPDEVPDEQAILIEPSTVVHRALIQAEFAGGERVVIFGPGTLGLLGISLARALGAAEVILVGTRRERLELGRRLGADWTVNLREDAAALGKLAGWADVALEASGSPEAFSAALAVLRRGGRLSLVSLYRAPLAGLDLNPLVARNLKVAGSLGSPGIWPQTIRLWAAGRIQAEGLVTHRFDLERAPEALAVAAARSGGAIKVAVEMERRL